MTSQVILPAMARPAAPPAASTSATAPSFCTASESLAAAFPFTFLALSALLPQAPASHPATLPVAVVGYSSTIPSPSLFAEQLFCSSLPTSSASPSIAGCFRMESWFFSTFSITKVVNEDNFDKMKPQLSPTSGSPALSETRSTAIGKASALSAVSPNAPLMQQICSWSVPAKIHFRHPDPKSSIVWFVHPNPWVVLATLICSILSVCFLLQSARFAILLNILYLAFLYLKAWSRCIVRFCFSFFQLIQLKQIRLGTSTAKAIIALIVSTLPTMAVAELGVMLKLIICIFLSDGIDDLGA